MDSLGYWRSVHSKPLDLTYKELEKVSSNIDKNAIVAKREKTARSIIRKLKREHNKSHSMALTTMQDIAGCRAVVRTIKDVNKIVNTLRKKSYIRVVNNYIKRPKIDGYRGVHLVAIYDYDGFEKLQVEIQVRTKIQHAWATAGEITELFTNKLIKHLEGEPEWKSFYKRLSEVFLEIDDNLITRDTDFENIDVKNLRNILHKGLDSKGQKLMTSLKKRNKDLKVRERFLGYAIGVNIADEKLAEEQIKSGYILIEINTQKRNIDFSYFEQNKIIEAQEEYIKVEKKYLGLHHCIVVLLSTQAAGGVKQAYPNYFADARLFLALLNSIV